MKKIWVVLILIGGLISSVNAQEVLEIEPITDMDLMKFAKVEVMTEEYLDKKTTELRELILNNEVIKGGARYNQIKSAWGNESKLEAAKVTPEEKAAYQSIVDFQVGLQQSVVDYKTDLIRDDSILGAALYNKITGAIKQDPTMKEKLDQMVAQMKTKPIPRF